MENVNIITSFLAGLLMFLAPCTLPLVPGFIAFISHGEREKVIKNALLFSLGFILTFMVFGLLAGLLGSFLLPYKIIFQKIGAIIVIIFGLFILNIFKLPIFLRFNLEDNFKNFYKTKYGSLFFGISFALGWTPCVGPVLGGIFFYATFSYSVFWSLFLFLFFALGFVIPFMLVAYLVSRGKSLNLKSAKIFTIFSGLLLIFVGVLLFVDDFGLLVSWFYKALNFINYQNIEKFL